MGHFRRESPGFDPAAIHFCDLGVVPFQLIWSVVPGRAFHMNKSSGLPVYGRGPLWGYCLWPGTGKTCWHCYRHQKYHPGSDIQQVLSLYLLGWINAFFCRLFWAPQGACTGCDPAAIWNIDSWPHTNIMRPSNLLYLFSWIQARSQELSKGGANSTPFP